MRKSAFSKIMLPLLALLLLYAPKAKAEGEYAWPANYDGVMLQGFYWDSYKDSKWTVLKANAAELSSYFNLIWVPNAGKSSANPSMGYDPVYWFSNFNSSFGNEAELRSMISTFKQFGTGIIEDVVVNHRNGATNWYDFPAETYNGKTYKLGLDAICKNDELANQTGMPQPTGAYDTGDNFDGCRDLDHTNPAVQEAVKAYLDFLKNDLGFTGWRYDMVKGYGAEYTKIYNESAKASYSVGEYWDNYDKTTSWIDRTGRTSAAFDFEFKWALNAAFPGMNFSKLVWKRNGSLNQPAGIIHMDTYQRYAVTFVDNHDTYKESDKMFTGDVEAANAFMLCSPGTPCVFYKHWLDKKDAIKKLIAIRKSVGLTNQCTVNVLETTNNRYVAEVTGNNGKLLIKIGRGSYDPSSKGYSTSDKVAGNALYSIWTKVAIKNLESQVAQLSFSPDGGTYVGGVKVTMDVANAKDFNNPEVVYTTDGSIPSLTNGTHAAPGTTLDISTNTKLKAVVVADGKVVSGVKEANYITSIEPVEIYVEKPESWNSINIYAWVSEQITSAWPGDAMTETATVDGKTMYYHNFGTQYPEISIIFNNGTAQTADISEVGYGKHYFRLNSDTGKSISVTEFKPQSSVTSVTGGELVVYPNPATDVINVKADKGVASVEVYTLSGAKVAESDTDAVSVASLQNGMYIYSATFADGTKVRGKFLKK